MGDIFHAFGRDATCNFTRRMPTVSIGVLNRTSLRYFHVALFLMLQKRAGGTYVLELEIER